MVTHAHQWLYNLIHVVPPDIAFLSLSTTSSSFTVTQAPPPDFAAAVVSHVTSNVRHTPSLLISWSLHCGSCSTDIMPIIFTSSFARSLDNPFSYKCMYIHTVHVCVTVPYSSMGKVWWMDRFSYASKLIKWEWPLLCRWLLYIKWITFHWEVVIIIIIIKQLAMALFWRIHQKFSPLIKIILLVVGILLSTCNDGRYAPYLHDSKGNFCKV